MAAHGAGAGRCLCSLSQHSLRFQQKMQAGKMDYVALVNRTELGKEVFR
jgi:hypothetical protein